MDSGDVWLSCGYAELKKPTPLLVGTAACESLSVFESMDRLVFWVQFVAKVVPSNQSDRSNQMLSSGDLFDLEHV